MKANVAIPHDSRTTAIRKVQPKSPFFTLLGVAMLVLAIAGFWPQYFSAVVGNRPHPNTQFWLVHAHAALFSIWLLLFISQAAMVMTGRSRLHRQAGPWVASYGFLIALIGLFAAIALAARMGRRQDDFEAAASFVFFPIVDMIYFAAFLAIAVIQRRRPELHKRAMLIATFSIAVVGLGRLVGRAGFESAFVWQSLTLAPLLIAAAYDALICRKVYALMAAGLALHWFRLNAETFATSEAWLPFGRALVAVLR